MAFESLPWPVGGLILGVKVDPCIAAWHGHYVSDKVEVSEWSELTSIKKVASWTFTDQLAVDDFPALWILLGNFPAAERLSVKQGHEAVFDTLAVCSDMATTEKQ